MNSTWFSKIYVGNETTDSKSPYFLSNLILANTSEPGELLITVVALAGNKTLPDSQGLDIKITVESTVNSLPLFIGSPAPVLI